MVGGFGFVGGRLAQEMERRGHGVFLGSRRRRPSPAWLTTAGVVEIRWDDEAALERCCQKIDAVVHAAGLSAAECAGDPEKALRVNGEYTRRMVDAAARAHVGRFVYLSTAHVYASPLAGRITEETPLTNSHPYATSHVAGENAVLQAGRSGRTETLSVRLSNAFGVPVPPNTSCWILLVNDLCRQAVESGHLTLRCAGAYRDFVSLKQVSHSIGDMLEVADLAALGDVVNLGSGRSVTVDAMARRVQKRCEAVLGFRPGLSSPPALAGPELDYATLRPLSRPDDIDTDWNAEIDALLRFCETEFGAGRGAGSPS